MPHARWLVIAIVGCSSNAPQTSQVGPSTGSTRSPSSRASSETLPTCEAPKPPAADLEPVRPAPMPPRGRGMFGLEGLQPRETPARGAACQAARSTLDATSAAILAAPTGPAIARRAAWDPRRDPARWTRVAQRLGLGAGHRATLGKHGFVVAAGASFWSYVEAYH